MKASEIVDVTPQEVLRVMAAHGVRTLIHGHTHRPAVHELEVNGQPARRIVLGDWDRQGWALQIDDEGFNQAPFELAPANACEP
jgi:UDP-2,3-diacylglucosamine hydrolase